MADNLLSLADHYDAFVFDAFGVLNVGQTAIKGAPECIEQLRALGKRVFVLTNGASAALTKMRVKFDRLGYDFTDSEIVSSRLAAEQAMVRLSVTLPPSHCWGAISGGMSGASDLPVSCKILDENPADVHAAANLYADVDAFVMLSSLTWNDTQQQVLLDALEKNPRPVVIANPDVVAPHEQGFSLEPGYYAHELLDRLELPLEFHGKPFPSVFTLIRERLDALAADDGRVIPDQRVAMLGDTLHTDVLGAKAAGWGAILVSSHGLFRGFDVQPFIARSGIVPDWIVPSI
ncbi:MAG: HAD hydrolase-like protein [Gammaproteobacteria bacterium]|nr:HAD hydrolase-like protein [Gammaproteobacteria bacterium]